MLVVVEGDGEEPPLRGAVARLVETLEANPAFRDPEVETSPDGRLAVVEALVVGDSRDARALDAVEGLRERDVPAIFDGLDAEVFVTGETAEVVDYNDLMETWLPRIIAFVLLLSFVLLTIAFRSIVLPAKAILLNLLSVGAAYGLMVLVFQKGIGNELFGLRETEVVSDLGAALPLLGAVRALDGLPRVPAEPDPRALPADGRQRGGDRARDRDDRAGDHRRRADHHRRVRRLRERRHRGDAAGRVRRRRSRS